MLAAAGTLAGGGAALAQPWSPKAPPAPAPRDPLREAANVQGLCQDRFERVRDTLAQSLECGDDIGASVAVFIDGEPVVDLWGGYFDGAFDRAWGRDTIITTHSTTKTMTAMAALVLADSGELKLDRRVSHYWPEFAAGGKSRIEVRQLLGHTSGLAGWTDDVTWDDVYDLDKSTALLARQEPWWQPGTAAGYHGITQGHLVSEVIRRITGKTLGRYFADHVAGPLGADYHIGTGPECDARVAPFVQAIPEEPLTGTNALLDRIASNPNLSPRTSNSIAWRRAEIGAANGNGNARSVAKVHAALAAEQVNGVQILSERGRRRVREVQSDGVDVVIGIPVRWGMGFALHAPLVVPNEQNHEIAFWGGNGGSLALVDFNERMSVSFVMNRWIENRYENLRNQRILRAVYACLAS